MEYLEQHRGKERVILVSVSVQMLDDLDAEEFNLLAQSADAEILEHIHAQRVKPDAKFFIGSGKAEEIAECVEELDANLVIVDHALTPAQARNLEQVIKCRVVDRTELILDIFAQRARTYEGKLQVELAQLQHLSSRLIRSRGNLDSQKGGIGLRGPGETLLETDRRLLRIRMGQLKAKIDKVRQTRMQGRIARQKAAVPTVSLVGYTNAGKSTLFNLLAKSDVYAADQLFATLDTTTRQLYIGELERSVSLSDTVGFIKDLPHGLVDAFQATLQEAIDADLLLHVIDASNPKFPEQIAQVQRVLAEIGASDIPQLLVFNKADVLPDGQQPVQWQDVYELDGRQTPRVFVSARTGAGLAGLRSQLAAMMVALTGTTAPADASHPPLDAPDGSVVLS